MATSKPTGPRSKIPQGDKRMKQSASGGKRMKQSASGGKVVSRSATSGKIVAQESSRTARVRGSAKVTNTAVRLSADDSERLDRLAEQYADGDKSATIRIALQQLEEQAQRNDSMRQFLDDWDQELGGRDPESEADAKRRYFS